MILRITCIATLILSLSVAAYANLCDNATLTNGTYLHANNIRTLIPASGSLFWGGENAQFNIEGPDGGFATIFAHGLWMGAHDSNGDLAVSIATYGAADGNSDYYPGPVMEDGSTSFDDCGNYDRAWSVYRYQIEAHLADFQDNGVIDNPIAEVVGWPGHGNAQFFGITGFELPDTPQGLAPFFDLNADGIYQPLQGEYPYVPQADIVPDQIVWSVFNTVGNEARESGSLVQLKMEIQLLAWAFNCMENPILNNTVFTAFKFINRSTQTYNNFKFGLWTDFDLGCYYDDYIGSAPEINTYYVYNKFHFDLCSDVPSAGVNPPVQAVTILNQALGGFMYVNNSEIIIIGGPPGEPIPPGPDEPIEYFNFLNNRFGDGIPLTQGGSGYDPSSNEPVNYAFPDNPNDPGGWSEYVLNPLAIDRRSLGNVAVPSVLLPGQVVEVDVAYSYHRTPDAGHLGNVNSMYENVGALQTMYDNAFAEVCSQVTICDDDCVWSGDLNADGIANHEDILALGFGLNAAGNNRVGPYNWAPQAGDSWNMLQFNGADAKHLDANGNGSCTFADIDKLFQHYNLTKPDYVPEFEYPVGDDIIFSRSGSNPSLEHLSPGELFFGRINLATDVENLRALAFTIEYDPQYFQKFRTIYAEWEANKMILRKANAGGTFDFAYYLRDTDTYLDPQQLIVLQLQMIDVPEELLPSDETFIRFRNIRAYRTDGNSVDLGAQTVRLQINNISVATEEPAWAAEVSLFPNPLRDRLYWRFGSVQPTTYRLYNLRGELLQSGKVVGEGLAMNDLPAGIYHLQLIHNQGAVTRKIVKQ